MDTPDINTIASMAASMSAEAIVGHFKEKGIPLQIVTGGIYPVGIASESTTMFVTALQPHEPERDAS